MSVAEWQLMTVRGVVYDPQGIRKVQDIFVYHDAKLGRKL